VQHLTPALHLWHCLRLVEDTKLAAGHLVHCWPSVHVLSVMIHSSQPKAPALAENDPASHFWHWPPKSPLYAPAGHGLQVLEFGAVEVVPGGQGAQYFAPLRPVAT
jgi:hypothetical protein